VTIKLLPDIFGVRLINHSVDNMFDLPIVKLSTSHMDGADRYIKSIEDRDLSFLILLILSIGVKLSSSGPVLYKKN